MEQFLNTRFKKKNEFGKNPVYKESLDLKFAAFRLNINNVIIIIFIAIS